MKTLLTALALLLAGSAGYSNAIPIEDARSKSDGSTVTISGIVTNGSELGTPRYMQDETAGIVVYDNQFASSVTRGDSVTVTGDLTTFSGLLEIENTTYTIHSQGNDLPDPLQLTPGQLGEANEAQLAIIKEVTFNDGGATFQGGNSYTFTANGESAKVYIDNGHPLVGQVIPSSEVNLTGLVSQYSFDGGNNGYQFLLRGADDISYKSSIRLSTAASVSNITHSGFDVSWETTSPGASYLITGKDTSNMTDTIKMPNDVSKHTVSITGKSAAEVVYYKAMSFNDKDTIESQLRAGVTQSASTGNIKVFFTNAVADSVADAETAHYLDDTAHDTLVQYINHAEESIDFAIYHLTNIGGPSIVQALNEAHSRGVEVRMIVCGSQDNPPLEDLNKAIHVLERPWDGTGIMHNKFVVFDAAHSNPDKAHVWTGSMNFTYNNVKEDANNIVIVQDQSLAKAFELEFEEMWGAKGATPDETKARFGEHKRSNTPQQFIVNENPMQAYFSPSDQVNKHITEVIQSANYSLSIGLMLITRDDITDAVTTAHQAGIATNVLTDVATGNSDYAERRFGSVLVEHFTHDDHVDGMFHDKYMIVDEGQASSDPIVLTGSHNWSNAANEINDENTLVIHDQRVANLFKQSFTKRFLDNYGSFQDLNENPQALNDTLSAQPEELISAPVLDNDTTIAEVNLEILTAPSAGTAILPADEPDTITYHSEAGFTGMDSVQYRISYKARPGKKDRAWVFFSIQEATNINHQDKIQEMTVYPNPGSGMINVRVLNNQPFPAKMQILDIRGQQLLLFDNLDINPGKTTMQLDLQDLNKGIYILKVVSAHYVHTQKLFIN